MPTYPLAFPVDPGIEEAKIILIRKTNVAQSIFTGAEQRSENPFHLWSVSGKIPIIDGATAAARDWRAFVIELRGQVGTFNLPVPGITGPSTNYSGSQGLVNGSSLLGDSIPTDGWTPNTSILNRGDFFMIGGELKMSMINTSSNGSGEATLIFEPAIVFSPDNNSNVVLDDPFITMRMTTDTTSWNLSNPVIHAFSFEAVEVQGD